jgi:hypothetical protein
MTVAYERDIRAQLERAVEIIEPVAPPLDVLRSRATKRTRARRTGVGVVAVAAVVVIVLIAVLVLPGSGGRETLQPAKAPTRASLQSYATSHGALKHIIGPYNASPGFYGAYATKAGIQVVTYHRNRWARFAPVDTDLGNGRSISLMNFDRSFQMARSTDRAPSLYVRTIGADVSYYGFVIYFIDGDWYDGTFMCPHNVLCRPGTAGMPYFHRTPSGVLTSVINDCSPSCAAGSDYRLNWNWLPKVGVFKATKVTKLVR